MPLRSILRVFASLVFLSSPLAAQPISVRAFVTTYCVTCHNDRLKTGSLTLENADAENVFNSSEIWEKVIVNSEPVRCRLPAIAVPTTQRMTLSQSAARNGTGSGCHGACESRTAGQSPPAQSH